MAAVPALPVAIQGTPNTVFVIININIITPMESNYKLNVGHALIGYAVFLRLDQAVIIMKNVMRRDCQNTPYLNMIICHTE